MFGWRSDAKGRTGMKEEKIIRRIDGGRGLKTRSIKARNQNTEIDARSRLEGVTEPSRLRLHFPCGLN